MVLCPRIRRIRRALHESAGRIRAAVNGGDELLAEYTREGRLIDRLRAAYVPVAGVLKARREQRERGE
jgi:hypothetical protein